MTIPKLCEIGGLILLLTLSTQAGPKIGCKEPDYQFGDKPNIGSTEHTFLIENQGDVPLQIGKIRACCGASASIGAQIILPGSNTTFNINLSLQGRKGEQRKSFYIGSNDPNQPYFQVRMIGNATAEVFIDPANVDFGQLRLTSEAEKIVRFVCAGTNLTLTITNLVVDTVQFTAKCERTNDGYRIKVRTVPPLKPGVTQGNMRILTDSGKYPRFDVHLAATLASDIQVVPQEIVLVEKSGKPEAVNRYVALRSKSNKPFKILKVEPPEDGIDVKVRNLAAGGYTCEMNNILPFKELDGKKVIISTDHEDGKQIAIPIRVVSEQAAK